MFTHDDILCATGARAGGSIESMRGVSIDTRTLQPNDLFVALRGVSFDGHSFLDEAQHKEAVGAVVDYELDIDMPLYIVDDTLAALQALAAYHRDRLDIPVIGITGTNGKTTVKEIVYSILSTECEPICSERNYNNHVGVPMTLLKMTEATTHAVVEMGMNHAGEIRLLASLASPTVGVITNVGHGHLEFLKSIEDVARAKAELLDAMPRGSVAVLPIQGECTDILRATAASHGLKIVTFGATPEADVSFMVTRTGLDATVGMLCTPTGRKSVTLKLLGAHNALNVAAAVAAAIAAVPTLKFEHITEAVEAMVPVELRCQMDEVGGIKVIADCYNANLDSVRAALDVLACAVTGRRIALLGDMKELGVCAPQCHRDAGAAAAKAGLSMLVAVGAYAEDIMSGARGAGMPAEALHVSPDVASAAKYLNNYFKPGDTVLVKGSRGVQLEDAIEAWHTTRHARRA